MAVGELAREDGDFTRQGFPDFIAEYAGDVQMELTPTALAASPGSSTMWPTSPTIVVRSRCMCVSMGLVPALTRKIQEAAA
jgi:hypothetical protein